MVTRKMKYRILASLRKLSLSHEARKKVKNKNKVDKALYACSHCDTLTYDGRSDKNFKELQQKYPMHGIVRGKVEVNHIEPVVDPAVGFIDFDTYIERLFCDEVNLECLCKNCHSEITKKQNKSRRKAA